MFVIAGTCLSFPTSYNIRVRALENICNQNLDTSAGTVGNFGVRQKLGNLMGYSSVLVRVGIWVLKCYG